MRFLIPALALSLALPALADHPGPQRFDEPVVRVDQLELSPARHGLRLHYKFAKRDLRALRRDGAPPVLLIDIDGRRERVRLDRRHGELRLDTGRGLPNTVHVSMVDRLGQRRGRTPVTLSLGGFLVEGVDLRVPARRRGHNAPVAAPAPPPRPRAPDWTYDDATQRACQSAFWNGRDREACLNAVRSAAYNPASSVRACDRAMTSQRETLRCVQAVGRSQRDLQNDIRACDRALVSDQRAATCVDAAALSLRPIDGFAQSCDRAFASDNKVERCIVSAASSRATDAQARQAIRRCDDYYASERDTLMCVERALPGQVAAR